MPPPDLEGGVPDSSVGSDPTATASSSTLEDIPSLIERAIAKLPPDPAASQQRNGVWDRNMDLWTW
jgi:hypothetical protein